MIPFLLKEHFYMHTNCIQIAPATTEWFLKTGFQLSVSSILKFLFQSYTRF